MAKQQIVKHSSLIKSSHRQEMLGYQSSCLWFTGLSGSGKSTIAMEVERLLFGRRVYSYVLDGDNIRHGLNSDLTFSSISREENIRRIGEVAALFVDAGLIVLVSFISPFRKDRQRIRNLLPEGKFIEIYVKADLETCKSRDPKGLYKKALAGEILDFTGVSSPYEEPEHPEITIDTTANSNILQNANVVVKYLENTGVIK